jgi:hypothetical protein
MAKEQQAAKSAATTGTRKLTFIGTVKTSANAVHLFVAGEEMDLAQDGDTWSGNESRFVGDTIDVNFTVNGFEGTDWDVAVAIDCPDGKPKIVTKSGTVGDPGGHGFAKTATIPADPCKAA